MKIAQEYFGSCPECGEISGWTNVRSGHICYCTKHKTMWCVGYNLFSGWKDEIEEEQRRKWNEIGLEEFDYVHPVMEGTPIFEKEWSCRLRLERVLQYAGTIVSAGIDLIRDADDQLLVNIERDIAEQRAPFLFDEGTIAVAELLRKAIEAEINRRVRNSVLRPCDAQRVPDASVPADGHSMGNCPF